MKTLLGTPVLSCRVQNRGFTFSLIRRRLIGTAVALPVAEWAEAASPGHLAGVAQLLSWVDENLAVVEDTEILVSHAHIASIDGQTAISISAPPTPPYVLDLQHIGTIDDPNFHFLTTWIQLNGQPVAGVRRIGAALVRGESTFRIPDPLFGIVESAETFNAEPADSLDGRFSAWARMRELLPPDTERSIQVDGYLNSTRVAHATSFSLSLHSGADGFTFDPVLFGPNIATLRAENDDFIIHETETLLPPIQQRQFAKERFLEATEPRARYALGSGWYVVLDEPVRLALAVVRKAQEAEPEIRKAFARNPRSFLVDALGDSIAEEVIDSIFLETAEYSARVRDVGIWQPKVLPWVKKSKETWLPESFGIRIDGQNIVIDPSDVPDLHKAIKTAVASDEAVVEWKGQEIPATPEALKAIQSLVGAVKPATAKPASDEPSGDSSAVGEHHQYVLEIDDNFSTLDYERIQVRRPTRLAEDVPSRVQTTLKSHQREGLRLLQSAWNTGQPGTLLADDMGLGKTLQALAFLAWLREAMESCAIAKAPILIVAPTGLLKNWEEEHNRHLHSPGIGAVVRAFGGGLASLRTQKGREIDLGLATLDADRLSEADWILTTYETLRDYQHSFCAIRYAVVVFDEMQKIKTPGTVMTHAAKALNADFILGLTGTPIENRLADLWCLIDTVEPGLLKDLAHFSRTYEKQEDPDALVALKGLLTDPTNTAPAVMLRRMKADRLKGLPEKIDHPLEHAMPPLQAEAYDEAVKSARNSGGGSKVLEALHRLRSISLHPLHPSAAQDDRYIDVSARLRAALEVLDGIANNNEKALIFLESQEMQPYLAGLLQRRYRLKTLPMLINGGVTGQKRQERVNAFQSAPNGFDVIILSPRAGGVGLTLTAANHVIHLSRWWNPAVEDQCTDRVYRIGQRRTVHVYYPMAVHPDYPEHSFDRRLHALLSKKRQLSRDLLMPPVGPDDARDLFEETVVRRQRKSFDIRSIDAMEPLQFEDWVLEGLRNAGFQVNKTPKTHDCGADGIAYHKITGQPYIVQCKHTQGATSPDNAISDLLKARECYQLNDPRLLAVTNAHSFGASARKTAEASEIQLICRDHLAQWPEIVVK